MDEKAPLLIVVGRLELQKGHRILLEAMATVQKEFPSALLVCLGDGSLRGELESMVKAKGLEGTVRFVGYQTNVSRWLTSADLSILPSLFEGLPMIAIESLASECPIVATAVDGTPEVVVPGKTGLLVPPGDPNSLAQGVLQTLRHPDRARQMADAGRRHVLDNFTVELMVRRTQDLYLESWAEHFARRHRQIPAGRRMQSSALSRGAATASKESGSWVD